ncbi:MAG: helicase-related protein, partial [Candidatus Binatia bacterium]
WGDADLVLIDESHNFRNQNAQRYGKMEEILGASGGRGRDGGRKKVILLTATPINNDLFDLYNQFCLITRGDRSYFASSGIGDLYRYFLKARRDSRSGDGVFALFNLLEEIVIRRTRPFIRMAYPNATIRRREQDGTWIEQPVHFPDRRLKTVYYNLEAAYTGIYDEVVSGIESLKLAPYNLEDYKKAGVEVDKFEAGREEALVGIFKSRYLKRFESSIEAFRISVRRGLAFLKTFESYILDGRLIKSTDFHKILRFLSSEDEEDDATPISLADEIDANEEARDFLETLGTIDPMTYDLRKLHEAVQHDVEVLSHIWQRVKDIKPEKDAKLTQLKELLAKELRGKKILIFSYYKDTARYLYRHLGHPENPAAVAFCKKLGGINVRRMDSGADTKERLRIIHGFAPKANDKPEWIGSDKEINVLISTDVLSEGQNLQDCGYLVNYDLHWNPTRMVQRAGRIDRIGTDFQTLWIYNVFPDQGLERLLGLVQSLNLKIADIDRAGFLDASVLGETVHPRNFNTLRRIREEDGSVIEEEEQFTELASNEFLAQQLKALIETGGQAMLESLPDGIHSGLTKVRARGVFFYFQARAADGGKLHFWKYYDLKEERIIDNRYIVANLIACQKDTLRVVDPGLFRSAFDLQEKVIEDILQSEEEKRALEVAPRSVDPIQQTVATALQSYLNHPDIDRHQAIEAIRFLNQPMLAVQVRTLRQIYRNFQAKGDIKVFLSTIEELRKTSGAEQMTRESAGKLKRFRREDLRLICFDILSSG